ncbi:hypothetical protein B0H11DRAFT_2242461 [Mycena galericulata]|nr:hypothetical protein B0H11DRAFT_2242461 [Mycena galericulata]
MGSDDVETEFDSLFSIGPGGIDVFMYIFDRIYQAIDETYHLVLGNDHCLSIIADVHSASRSLLFSLQHLRAKNPRSLWDPIGCRELIELLNGDKLPIGLADNRMLAELKGINVHSDSASAIFFQLKAAFGDAKDAREMFKDILIGGPHGLPFFYENVVVRILDDIEHAEHDTILADIRDSCTGLARKILNYLKSPRSSRPPVSTPNVDGGSSSNTHGMRTRRSGTGGNGAKPAQTSK